MEGECGEGRKEKSILVNIQGGTNYKQNHYYILLDVTIVVANQ